MLEQKQKIAIVDDDVELTSELKNILSDCGYQVTIYNSLRFVNEFIDDKPDVLLIDIWFDGLADGLNQAKAINYQKKLSGIPIILMSSDPKLEKYAELVNADRHINKPLDPEELLAILAELLPKQPGL